MSYPPNPGEQPPYGTPPSQPYGTPPPQYAPPSQPYGAPPQQYAPPPGYGAPQPAYGQQPMYGMPVAAPPSNGLATTSLILGICSVFFGILTGIPAVITGHMALGKIKENPMLANSKGQAMAGLIIGYVAIGLTVLCAGFFILAAVAASTTPR